MNNIEYKLWNKLTFRTIHYSRNFDLINKSDSFISEHTGTISEMRLAEQLTPIIVGEYAYSIWNLTFGWNANELLKYYKDENSYRELLEVVKNGEIDITNNQRIIFIHNLVIKPDYRKMGVTEEFIEHIYRNYSDSETIIIGLFEPIQCNKINLEYFYLNNNVKIFNNVAIPSDFTLHKASDYYALDALNKKDDAETNELKLFALASKCGFMRIGNSHLFELDAGIVINRMHDKLKFKK